MDSQKIGAFLRELRKEKNLTQEQLAEVLGVISELYHYCKIRHI